ncbi:hypothetical protein [Nocardioides jishulii]|uniref:DUF2384 domain-containing protein n=1 Tax=Nocardioides jishulii TaxID=2575440 RepID=A0A4U2YU63_9ACTN|nr:hypothetical protein [Nocardioides jishulii]QCX28493.1 hypothetical protein FCL41_13875 [Nocardioides jishulii]TKI64614.1 hypothetical protein FC770_05700 [Nocardioides jishulii]
MAEQVGPDFYDERAMGEALGSDGEPLAPVEVRALREARKVLALPTADGYWVFPTWQVVDGAVLPGVAEVMAAFEGAPVWSVGLWMTTPDEQWHGRTPAEVLRSGDAETVVEAAADTAARWA